MLCQKPNGERSRDLRKATANAKGRPFWAKNTSRKPMSLYAFHCFSGCTGTYGAMLLCAQLSHITTLTRMLANIRKPYLNVDSRNTPLSRQGSSRSIDLAGTDQSWAAIRHLSNEERDQIDLQARVILTRCADRVKEMETLEKRAYIHTSK